MAQIDSTRIHATRPQTASTTESLRRDPSRRDPRAVLLIFVLLLGTLVAHGTLRTLSANPAVTTPSTGGSVHTGSMASAVGGTVTFSGQVDRTAVHAGGDGRVRLELVMLGADRPSGVAQAHVPTDVVVVLDRSGSMDGEKIEEARASVRELLEHLRPGDRFALVTFSSDARVDIPLESTDATATARWRQRISAIRAGGGTNMVAGMDLALGLTEHRAADRAGRVLLMSDGLAGGFEQLIEQAATTARRENVLSTLGIGLDFNEDLMSSMADAGTGNFHFLEDTAQLASVMQSEFEASRDTVANALVVHLTPAPGVRVVDAAGYPLDFDGSVAKFRPGNLFAGQERRVWVTFEVSTATAGASPLGDVALHWKDGDAPQRLQLSGLPQIARVERAEQAIESMDREVWARSVVEEAYGGLRQRVATLVREGRRDEAKQEIAAFNDEQSRYNAVMASPEVAATLEEAAELEQEVDDAFTGADQVHKQNYLSKKQLAAANDARRAGSKKALPPAKSPQR